MFLSPVVARCADSTGMFGREFSRYGTLVQTDTLGSVGTTDGKIDVMLLIAAGPGGKGAISAEWFMLERMENGLRFAFFDAEHKNVGATHSFECIVATATSATWTERHEGTNVSVRRGAS